MIVSLSPGQAHDGTEGHKLLQRLGPQQKPVYLLMDRAYQGNQTRQMAQGLGCIPVVPPRRHRLVQWGYDRELYKRRNGVDLDYPPAATGAGVRCHLNAIALPHSFK